MRKTSSAARDDAHRRLKRATAITFAGSGALVVAFAGLAAKALPGRSTAKTTTANTRATASSTRATPPPLIPAQSAVTPAAPSSTPQQTQSPPVVVSGGS